MQLVVRDGKGEQDRVTVLPECSVTALRAQIDAIKVLHEEDSANGQGELYLPFALAKKYPGVSRQFCWTWIFPAWNLARELRSKTLWRHSFATH